MINPGEFLFGAIGIFVFALLLLLVFWYVQLYKYYNGLHKITGPPYVPILGHALKLKNKPETMKYLVDKCIEHNGIAKIFAGFHFSVLVTDYKFMEFVFTSQTITKKSFNYKFLENWLGTGLILSDGAKWKSRRKIITPAFHFEMLHQYIEVFDSSSDILVQKLQNEVEAGSASMNMYDFIPYCTLDAICETAMRTKMNLQEKKETSYMNAIVGLTNIAMDRTIDPIKHSDFLYQFSQLYRKEKKLLETLHGHADSIIKKRRELKLKNSNENIIDAIGKKMKITFIDILMQATVDGKPLSDEDIIEEVETFMFAGHDTTSEAICFALYEIARNPVVQAKILEEQMTIFHEDIFKITTMEELHRMKYLEMVIKETLRLYPSVPSIAREVTEDFEYDGMLFKKGLNINLFIYAAHRNSKYFPDPDRFDPERFGVDNYLKLHPFAYVPFSAGPRNCIGKNIIKNLISTSFQLPENKILDERFVESLGKKFAFLEMKLVIAKLIRNFKLQPCSNHVLMALQKVTMHSTSGIIIKLMKRNFA